MTSDGIIFLFFSFGLIVTGLFIREIMKRKRIENRLWGIVASQGLPVTALSDDIPMPIPHGNNELRENRLEQLESQMDQVAAQLERLAESQDFLARIMTERMDKLPPPPPEVRMTTPH